MQKKLTLQQLVSVVGEGFRQLFDEFEFWVEAEIAAIKPYKSRLYCEFIQADEQGSILAQAKGIIREPSIMQKFLKKSGLGRSELVGTTVLIRGVCTFHQKYGRSITVRELSAEYTRGKQLTHREKVIEQLKKDGLRKNNQSRVLAMRPLRCAVISGSGSAGFDDFSTVLSQSGYSITLTPYRSSVEGNKAIVEVADALKKIINHLAVGDSYDCIVLARGGGAKDGFLWQDDYTIGKLIGSSPIPVIIAIGHTRDQTLLDQTVYHSAKTPTDAAYYLIEHAQSIEVMLDELYQETIMGVTSWYETTVQKIETIYEEIESLFETVLIEKSQNLEQLLVDITAYDPNIQLQKGWGLVTNSQGTIQRGALSKDSAYTLHHGSSSYTISIE